MWYIHTREYYSSIKRNEVLLHAITWMKLEDITLSKRSQTQKDKYCVFYLYEVLRIGKFIETESSLQASGN
jgi:hypothetical protein